MKQRSILIIAPHPDDETLGCGGIIAKSFKHGDKITVVVVTDGCNLFRLSQWKIETDPTPAEISEMRKEETRRSLDILGCGRQCARFLDIEDASLTENIEAATEMLSSIIEEVTPDEIYVTSEYEYHADHRAACKAVCMAMDKTQSQAKLFRYTILLPDGTERASITEPTITVDISKQLKIKCEAANQFDSHLKIVAKGQSEPFFADVAQWTQPNEVFFVE